VAVKWEERRISVAILSFGSNKVEAEAR